MVKVIMAGMEGMIANDGTKTNEESFWQLYLSRFGGEQEDNLQMYEDFYRNEFRGLAGIVQTCPWAPINSRISRK